MQNLSNLGPCLIYCPHSSSFSVETTKEHQKKETVVPYSKEGKKKREKNHSLYTLHMARGFARWGLP